MRPHHLLATLAAFAASTLTHAQECPPLSAERAAALAIAEAIERAGVCHPDVRAAAGALSAAGADVITAGQSPNPQLTAGAGSVGKDLGNRSLFNKTFDHSVRVDQTVERGGKPALRRAASEALRDAARADLIDAQRRARQAVAQAYYELVASSARRTETEASLSLAGAAQRAQALRVKTGDVAPIEATRLSLDTIRVQGDLRQAEADLRTARGQLASMLGAEAQVDVLAASDSWPPAVAPARRDPAPTDDLSKAPAEGRRPDVVAAQSRLAAARESRELARALKTRDVSVGLQFDRWPVSQTNTSGTGNTVSVSVSVPLFLRHAYEGESARAEADVGNAEEALRKARLAAQSDLTQAWSHWDAASARRALAVDELTPAAEQVAASAELAYRRGALSLLEVLDARRSLRAARIERISAEADAAKAAAELEAAKFTVP